jgi:hypothetical protein
MVRLRFEDPVLIAGIMLVYASSVLLWGMYGCYPYHYSPWPIAPQGILDNIFTNILFLGISLLIASFIIQRVEVQRSKSATNALCNALARLAVFADMRIVRDCIHPSPSREDLVLFRLFHFGGTANASREMEATQEHFSLLVHDEIFLEGSDVRTMYLPLVPRVQRYIKDTEGICRDIRGVLISRAITNINDENIIQHLEIFENIFKEFDDNINCYASDGYIEGVVAEINNFLIHAKYAYMVLKGEHRLHPIGALYGPEDPQDIRI